jgi:hypothetical protein
MAEDVNKDFAASVKKLTEAGHTLYSASKKIEKASDELSGSAGAEQRRESEKREGMNTEYLATIAGAIGGLNIDDLKGGKSDEKSGGIFASIARAVGGLGAGLGAMVGGAMRGIAMGAATAPKFIIAMGALGTGIAAFMLPIAGAAWLGSKAFPEMAKNMASFESLDGKKLKEVGDGMAALGLGLGSQGLGSAMGSLGGLVGGIADGIGGMLGIPKGDSKTIFAKMEEFGKVKLDSKNIKNNAEAMTAYGIAMSAGGAGDMLGSIASLGSAVFGKLASMIGGAPPLEKLKLFGDAKIDGEGVKKNATAMMAYAKAMGMGAVAGGAEAVASTLNMVTSIFDGISKVIGGKSVLDTQIESLQKISGAKGIDSKKIDSFARAMLGYTGAMALGAVSEGGKALASGGNMLTSFFDGASKILGGEGVLDTQIAAMQKMSKVEGLDIKNIKHVSTALGAYAGAMGEMALAGAGKTGASFGKAVSVVFDSVTEIFGGKNDPIDDMKKFASHEITDKEIKSVQANGAGLKAYVEAMKGMGTLNLPDSFGDSIKSLMSGIGGIFTKDKDPMLELEKFAKRDIDPTKVKKNVEALQEFAKLGNMNKARVSVARFTADLLKSIPALEVAIMGGTIGEGWISSGTKLKGLASAEIGFREAAANIQVLRASLGMETSKPQTVQGQENSDGDKLWNEKLTKSIDALTVAMLGASGGGGSVAVNAPTSTVIKKTVNLSGGNGTARRAAG